MHGLLKRRQSKIVSRLAAILMALALVMPYSAFAKERTFSILANTPVITGTSASVSGTATASGPGIGEGTVNVGIDWNEDGSSEIDVSNVVDIDSDATCDKDDCSLTWGPVSHTYAPGTHKAFAAVYHGTASGQDGFNSSQVAEIDIVIPDTDDGSISGSKFNDENADGEWDEGEHGLSGWLIRLYGPEEDIRDIIILPDATDTTDSNGDYSFTGLEYGAYRICETTQSNWEQTYPDPIEDACHDVILTEESHTITGLDFGNHYTAPEGGLLAPTLVSPANGAEKTGSFDLVWNGVTGATGYVLELSTSTTMTATTTGTTFPLVNPAVDDYSWRVMAFNTGTTSDWSTTWNFSVVTEESGLAAPVLVSPANNSFLNGTNGIDLDWNDVSGATEYLVHVMNSSTSTTPVVSATTTASTLEVNLPEGHYYWHVEAANSATTSPWSSMWHFVVDNTAPTTTFSSPTTGSDWEDYIPIIGVSNDLNNVASTTLYTAPYANGSCGAFTYLTSFTNSNLADPSFEFNYNNWIPNTGHSYCLKAVSSDVAGNVGESPILSDIYFKSATTPSGGGGNNVNNNENNNNINVNVNPRITVSGSRERGLDLGDVLGASTYLPLMYQTLPGTVAGASIGLPNTGRAPVELAQADLGTTSTDTPTTTSYDTTANNVVTTSTSGTVSSISGWWWLVIIVVLILLGWLFTRRTE